MNGAPSGRATRTGRSVMELLAEARPASLDPGMDRARRASDLSAVLGTAGTPPGSAGAPERVDPPRERPWTGGWAPRRRWLAFGSGLTLAGVIAAAITLSVFAATSVTSERPRATSGQPGQQPTVLSARQILLTAAANAAQAPAAGRYWRVEDVSGSVSAAGPNAHPYAVAQRQSPEVTWDARSPVQRSWTLPSAGSSSSPATPGAATAWRADGSPALPATKAKQQAWWQAGGGVGYFGNASPTFAQFQALPSDPAGLEAAVRKAAEEQRLPAVPRHAGHAIRSVQLGVQPTLSQGMFGVYGQLLKSDPITPQVRATVFQLIAQLPGVRSIGKVTDPLGRTGYGIALAASQDASTGDSSASEPSEEVLVIAPASGALLADEDMVVALPTGVRPTAAGAVPGPTGCPPRSRPAPGAEQFPPGNGAPASGWPDASPNDMCITGETLVSGSTYRISVLALGPRLALAPGQVLDYDAVISAGWTNASPHLPPLSQQFSVSADGQG